MKLAKASCLLLVLVSVLAVNAGAQSPPSLQDAYSLWQESKYEPAIDALDDLLDRGALTNPEDTRTAYAILGSSHFRLGRRTLAFDAFCDAYKADPLWRPSEYPDLFLETELELIERAKAVCLLGIDPGTLPPIEEPARPGGDQEVPETEPEARPEEPEKERYVPSPVLDEDRGSKNRSGAMLRSFFIPGLGQHYKGQHLKAVLFHAGTIAGAAMAVLGHLDREDAVDQYFAAKANYERAVGPDQIDYWFAQMEMRSQEVDDAKKFRNMGGILLGAVWVVNLVDAALGFPLGDGGDSADLGTVFTCPLGRSGDGLQTRLSGFVEPVFDQDAAWRCGIRAVY